MLFQLLLLPLLASGVLFLPRKWVIAPYIIAATQLPRISIVAAGAADLGMLRILIALGLFRIMMRGEWRVLKWHRADTLMVLWALWTVLSAVGHHAKLENPFTMRMGLVGDHFGFYFLVRCWIVEWDDLRRLVPLWVALISILGTMMFIERVTLRNPYSVVGAVPTVLVRNDKPRPMGPFAHAILAGTAGAATLPFLLLQFRERRRLVGIGTCACVGVVFLSNSSGPISTLILVVASLVFWRWRRHLKSVLFLTLIALCLIQLIKTRPIWYLMQYVDFTGGSTGYHRAALIDATIGHFNEWWLFGSDYTRHWMPFGVSWSEDHVDFTNQFVGMGVKSGVLPAFLTAWLIWICFKQLWQYTRSQESIDRAQAFYAWCLGGALFAHLITFFSVAYFDQSYIFFYLILGCVPGIAYATTAAPAGVSAVELLAGTSGAPAVDDGRQS